MAIYFPASKITDSDEAKLAAGFAITAEGQPLMNVPGQGLQPADADVTTGIFAGFALCNQSAAALPMTYAVKVEEFIAAAATAVMNTQFASVSGQIGITMNGAAVASGDITVSGTQVTVANATVGAKLVVTYKFMPTAAQQIAMQGNIAPSGVAGALFGQTGRAKRGVIYTDQYDASINWGAVATVKFNGAGLLTGVPTIATGADVLPGAYVVHVPTATQPFLGIEFSAA